METGRAASHSHPARPAGGRAGKKILAWNIRHGGGKRVDAILEALQSHAADVIVLTEFRNNPVGDKIRGHLSAQGWPHQSRGPTETRRNGVLIAARDRLRDMGPISHGLAEGYRLRMVDLGYCCVLGVYMPNLRAKQPYWQALVAKAPEFVDRNTLLVGDFNTGRHYLDEKGATYVSADYMDRIEAAGFQDLWRGRNPERREFSWFSQAGNGFRLDHAFASPSLAERLIHVGYSHGERESGVSDHSALVAEFAF